MSRYTLSESTEDEIANTIQRIKSEEYVHETVDTDIDNIEIEIEGDTTEYRNGHRETECIVTILVHDMFENLPTGRDMPDTLADVSEPLDTLSASLTGVLNKNREDSSEIVFESIPRASNEDIAFYTQTLLFNVDRPN